MTDPERMSVGALNAAIMAIQAGDAAALRQLLDVHPDLVQARDTDARGCKRSLLHIATDWPGNRPDVASVIALLVDRGLDPNVRFEGKETHRETPLHWAASSDDVAATDALIGAGADIEADGAVIGGGTPIADAVAFGQWKAARRLVEHGARTALWQAAALGLMDRVRGHFDGTYPSLPWSPRGPDPSHPPDEVTHAFWSACHGGQREAAAFLLDHGADVNWVGHDGLTPLDAAEREKADPDFMAWLRGKGAKPARDLRQPS